MKLRDVILESLPPGFEFYTDMEGRSAFPMYGEDGKPSMQWCVFLLKKAAPGRALLLPIPMSCDEQFMADLNNQLKQVCDSFDESAKEMR